MVNCTITPATASHLNRKRKRKQNMSNWKTNVAKAQRNSGQAYVSIQTGSVIPAIQLPQRVRQPSI